MYILTSLGSKATPFLPEVVPLFIRVIEAAEPRMREHFTKQLGALVSIAAAAILPFVPPLLQLVRRFWPDDKMQASCARDLPLRA